jgi:hypothetical protein
MAAREQPATRERRIVNQQDTNLFGGEFTPFRDLWNSLAGDLGITTKRMRDNALATAAEEEAIWRDTSSAVTSSIESARQRAENPDDVAQLETFQTQLDAAGRLMRSSNPKLQEAGASMLGKVTDAQRAFDERQETQRIARETQQATIEREIGGEAWSRLQAVSDDLRTESAPFLGQKEAWGRIKASMADPSEAGDYALLYSVHKMLDPASTVLASEFQNSQNLAGVPDIIVTARNKLREGQRLTPEQRAAFVKMGELQYRQSSEQQAERNGRYLERARAGGVPEKYLDTLQIPVFSPGDMPTNFGKPQANPLDQLAPKPEERVPLGVAIRSMWNPELRQQPNESDEAYRARVTAAPPAEEEPEEPGLPAERDAITGLPGYNRGVYVPPFMRRGRRKND